MDARPLRPGEEEEPESMDDEVSGDDDYREDTFTVDVQGGGVGQAGVQGAGVQSGYVGSAFDYAQQAYDPYWAHSGDMGQIIQQRRPPTFVIGVNKIKCYLINKLFWVLVRKGLSKEVTIGMSNGTVLIDMPMKKK